MQFRFFSIPVQQGQDSAAELNGKVDYKDVLTDAEFAVFARLRALRKEMSEREGIAAYAIFTNEQLAEIVRGRIASLAGLRQLPGVGEARTERYGAAFLTIVQEAALPAGGVAGDAAADAAADGSGTDEA